MKLNILIVTLLASITNATLLPSLGTVPTYGQSTSTFAGRHGRPGTTVVYPGCSQQQVKVIEVALSLCSLRAWDASLEAVQESSTKYRTYFKLEDDDMIMHVYKNLQAIHEECTNIQNGYKKVGLECGKHTAPLYRGQGVYPDGRARNCNGLVPAYNTLFRLEAKIVLCPEWFDQTKILTIGQKCHQHDRPSVLINEISRLPGFGSTQDFDAYGFEALFRLPGMRNMYHADSYALFAQAIGYETIHGLGTCSGSGAVPNSSH